MYGEYDHFQYSKGNNSKSRKTRVTVHVFCMPSHSVSSFMKICQAVLKLWSGHKNCTQTHTHKIENYIPHCMHTS